MPKTNKMTKKKIIMDYLLSTRFTARDRQVIANLLIGVYKDGFTNALTLKFKTKNDSK